MALDRLAPNLEKAALIMLPSARNLSPIPRVVSFQYNPLELSRDVGLSATETTPARLKGAPSESIQFTAFLDAIDAKANGHDEPDGIYPQLSALELMMYPSAQTVAANTALAIAGSTNLLSPEVPTLLFVWGKQRVLPVAMDGLAITENVFDHNLVPVRAEVAVQLRVLNYSNGGPATASFWTFYAHHVRKEVLSYKRNEALWGGYKAIGNSIKKAFT